MQTQQCRLQWSKHGASVTETGSRCGGSNDTPGRRKSAAVSVGWADCKATVINRVDVNWRMIDVETEQQQQQQQQLTAVVILSVSATSDDQIFLEQTWFRPHCFSVCIQSYPKSSKFRSRSSKQDGSVSSGTWHGWAIRKTRPEPYIRRFAGYPRTGGAAQDVRVAPGYGPWKQTSSRSITVWTQPGHSLRTENDGSNLWKRLRSSQGHACDDDESTCIHRLAACQPPDDNAWIVGICWPCLVATYQHASSEAQLSGRTEAEPSIMPCVEHVGTGKSPHHHHHHRNWTTWRTNSYCIF